MLSKSASIAEPNKTSVETGSDKSPPILDESVMFASSPRLERSLSQPQKIHCLIFCILKTVSRG